MKNKFFTDEFIRPANIVPAAQSLQGYGRKGGLQMKKFKLSLIFPVIVTAVFLSGCGAGFSDNKEVDAAVAEAATDEVNVPQVDKIKTICELATLKCKYHNVAKSTKEAGEGLLHIGEKERTFWIEYTGIAEISFKTEEIKMKQDGTQIIITLPRPQITCKVDSDSWDEDSYVISDDRLIQKNPITAADQTWAINEAQTVMQDSIRNNSSLLNTAELQAKELIENYINQIGEATGVTYQISWESIE